MTRLFFLMLSKNKLLNHLAKKFGLQFGAKQVIAGTTLEEARKIIEHLNEQGFLVTVDHLGEFVTTREEALQATVTCLEMLEKINKHHLKSQLSIKLTQLGLSISPQFCYENVRKIVMAAERSSNFVCIDMESSDYCQDTITLLESLRNEFPDTVGTVIQAYLFRAKSDIQHLKGARLRLVKGAYKESKAIAFQTKEEIDVQYFERIKEHLREGEFTAIATHDHRIIEKVKIYCFKERIPRHKFEFQLLYGFRESLQRELVKQGYQVRIYVPYGNDWFAYFMRRLAERPQNVSFALKGFLGK
ncbi:proline dehydrogenase family protein [Alkalihalobacillus sp. 1P02AB]|uniref:proline dehydrogenase family protein n=1 Tax=Alkalihalobacillus sp. 1P02AB TaxID=3132260 RepID=UPI0039A60AB9